MIVAYRIELSCKWIGSVSSCMTEKKRKLKLMQMIDITKRKFFLMSSLSFAKKFHILCETKHLKILLYFSYLALWTILESKYSFSTFMSEHLNGQHNKKGIESLRPTGNKKWIMANAAQTSSKESTSCFTPFPELSSKKCEILSSAIRITRMASSAKRSSSSSRILAEA